MAHTYARSQRIARSALVPLVVLAGAAVLFLSCDPFDTDPRYVDVALAGGSLEVGAYYLEHNDVEASCRQLERLQPVLNGGEYEIGIVGSVDTSPIASLLRASRERDLQGMRALIEPADKALFDAQAHVYGKLAGIEGVLAPQLVSAYSDSVRNGRIVNQNRYSDAVATVRAFARIICRGRDGAGKQALGSLIQRDGAGYLSGVLQGLYFKAVGRAFTPLDLKVALPAPDNLSDTKDVERLVRCLQRAIKAKKLDRATCPEAQFT